MLKIKEIDENQLVLENGVHMSMARVLRLIESGDAAIAGCWLFLRP